MHRTRAGSCDRKTKYNFYEAVKVINDMKERPGYEGRLTMYHCDYCGRIHLGRRASRYYEKAVMETAMPIGEILRAKEACG